MSTVYLIGKQRIFVSKNLLLQFLIINLGFSFANLAESGENLLPVREIHAFECQTLLDSRFEKVIAESKEELDLIDGLKDLANGDTFKNFEALLDGANLHTARVIYAEGRAVGDIMFQAGRLIPKIWAEEKAYVEMAKNISEKDSLHNKALNKSFDRILFASASGFVLTSVGIIANQYLPDVFFKNCVTLSCASGVVSSVSYIFWKVFASAFEKKTSLRDFGIDTEKEFELRVKGITEEVSVKNVVEIMKLDLSQTEPFEISVGTVTNVTLGFDQTRFLLTYGRKHDATHTPYIILAIRHD